MALFDDEKLTRLTISITRAQRRELGFLAQRAGRGVSLGRIAREALGRGLASVRRELERTEAAQSEPPE